MRTWRINLLPQPWPPNDPMPETCLVLCRRLYIIDTMAQAYRLHTGFGTQRLTDSEGRDTSMLHGFMAILLRVLAHKPPATHMAIVVDAPGATFRWAKAGGQRWGLGRFGWFLAQKQPATHI